MNRKSIYHVGLSDEGWEVVVGGCLSVKFAFWGAIVVTKEESGRSCLIKVFDVVERRTRFRHWHRISVDSVLNVGSVNGPVTFDAAS